MSNEILKRSLLADAEAIREQFKKIRNPRERQALKEQYERIDRQLEGFKDVAVQESVPDLEVARRRTGDTRANWKLREEAIEEGMGPSASVLEKEKTKEDIEKGRRELLEKAKAGAGDATFKRIKGEIDYLLNNYSSANDNKIETLIDKWRRSGDPHYDPAIRLRFRKVRKKKAQTEHPI